LLAAVAVGVGGATGAMARHAVGLAFEGRRSLLAVNTIGSFALGGVVAAPVGSPIALGIGVGFCGAFTTFSSFAVETVVAAGSDGPRVATAFAALTLAAAVVAVLVGAAAVTAAV
jgi:CrcB protein